MQFIELETFETSWLKLNVSWQSHALSFSNKRNDFLKEKYFLKNGHSLSLPSFILQSNKGISCLFK